MSSADSSNERIGFCVFLQLLSWTILLRVGKGKFGCSCIACATVEKGINYWSYWFEFRQGEDSRWKHAWKGKGEGGTAECESFSETLQWAWE